MMAGRECKLCSTLTQRRAKASTRATTHTSIRSQHFRRLPSTRITDKFEPPQNFHEWSRAFYRFFRTRPYALLLPFICEFKSRKLSATLGLIGPGLPSMKYELVSFECVNGPEFPSRWEGTGEISLFRS